MMRIIDVDTTKNPAPPPPHPLREPWHRGLTVVVAPRVRVRVRIR